jgi:8-hydroxy-5-deazaflavin:NADPH oxidoreductase
VNAPKRIAILGGTGNLGYGLAVRLAVAGHAVVIGSRLPERASDAAEKVREVVTDSDVCGTTNEQAAEFADFVVIAVPFAHQASTLKTVHDHLREGQIVIDACVPLATAYGGRPTQLTGVWHGSSAQQASALVPDGVSVVSALHTLSADLLADIDVSLDQDTLICGNRKADKAAVIELLSSIKGLRVVDAGRLEMSRITESLTPLLIGINIRNKVHSGFRITGIG